MNSQQEKQWFSSGELAGLPAMPGTPRGVFKRATREQWPSRPHAGRGGGHEYSLNAFPNETQLALAQRIINSSPAGATPALPGSPEPAAGIFIPAPAPIDDADSETRSHLFDARPEKTKARARRSLAAVQDYFSLIASGLGPKIAAAATAKKHQRCVATLRRDLKIIKGKPEQQWLDLLVDDYPGRTACAQISPEAWEVLKADYLRLERPTANACIGRLKRSAKDRDWIIPSNRTLQRRLAKLPRALSVLAREGAKAAQQLYPAQQRDKRALHALQIINGDGYKHNLWIAFPDGEVIRAKTWFWQDVYSSRIIGFRTDKTEHTDMIRLSFGDLVEQYGIPDKVLLDNTLAAANKTMSGGVKHRFRFKVKPEEPLGVFPLMGSIVMWATPEHGQAKPVERSFGIGGIGEIVDKAPDFAGAWTGANTLDKPDYNGKTRAIPVADLEAVIAREIAHYNAQTGRRGAIQRGRSFDEVFSESYAVAPIRRPTEAQRRLWLLATEPVRANSRDGSITLDAGRAPGMPNRYWSEQLVDFAGRQVAARFDPKRLHEGVHIYTCDGRYVCFAACVEAKGFDDQGAAREHARARNQFKRATRDQLTAERRMTVLEAAKAYAGTAPPMIPAPARGNVVRGEFRDPLERPVPQAAAMTPEQAEAHEQLVAELTQGAPAAAPRNVKPIDDPRFRYARWLRLEKRVQAGEQLVEREAEFFKGYAKDDEHRSMADFFEEFRLTEAEFG